MLITCKTCGNEIKRGEFTYFYTDSLDDRPVCKSCAEKELAARIRWPTMLDKVLWSTDRWRPSPETEKQAGFYRGLQWGVQLAVVEIARHMYQYHDEAEWEGADLKVVLMDEIGRLEWESRRWLEEHDKSEST